VPSADVAALTTKDPSALGRLTSPGGFMRGFLAIALCATAFAGCTSKHGSDERAGVATTESKADDTSAQTKPMAPSMTPGASAGSSSANAAYPQPPAATPPQPVRSADPKPDPRADRKDTPKVGAKIPAPGSGSRPGPGIDPTTGGDSFTDYGRNPWTETKTDYLSTFAADVDTASYTIARRKLTEGWLPPPASIRVEEFVNYFTYTFPEPTAGSPFSVVMDAAPSPVEPARHILRVGVATKGKAIGDRKKMNLIFLVDVSGSMSSQDRLPLARKALAILTNNLSDGDTVGVVTYAGRTRVVLHPTGIEHKDKILAAIDSLRNEGATGMASGLDLAYDEALQGVRPNSVSRVIVLTDGDANVGAHTHAELLKIIASRAQQGVTLSTIGFGMGNYRDNLMEQLADKGNGNNYYVDNLDEAKRIFQERLGATLEVVAQDVKMQVAFDSTMVARYRLLGYENRDIADKDFRNDAVDAGQVGAGHQVTAMYELELTEQGKRTGEALASVRIRWKVPGSKPGTKASETAFPMIGGPAKAFASAPADLRFAFAVAAFADVLRNGVDAEHWALADLRDIAKGATYGLDDRTELVALMNKAIALKERVATH
jgi:Ca-activated chloride channel homolog